MKLPLKSGLMTDRLVYKGLGNEVTSQHKMASSNFVLEIIRDAKRKKQQENISNLGKGGVVEAICLDLYKAFVRVNHHIILSKLSNYKLSPHKFIIVRLHPICSQWTDR